MISAKEHYESFLAEHYTWMFGDYEARVQDNKDFFERRGITPGSGGKALDLGCGSGFQSIALAELGFKVLSIDMSKTLLDELLGRSAGRVDLDLVHGDMLDYRNYADKGPFEVAVCMGDTLTHVEAKGDVSTLFEQVYDCLEHGGRFALSFRDLTAEFRGIERIIPVRSDDDKLMATFLEYEENYVNVHDIIFVKEDSGWALKKSAYKKLRLGMHHALTLLQNTGFRIGLSQVQRGFSIVVAHK